MPTRVRSWKETNESCLLATTSAVTDGPGRYVYFQEYGPPNEGSNSIATRRDTWTLNTMDMLSTHDVRTVDRRLAPTVNRQSQIRESAISSLQSAVAKPGASKPAPA